MKFVLGADSARHFAVIVHLLSQYDKTVYMVMNATSLLLVTSGSSVIFQILSPFFDSYEPRFSLGNTFALQSKLFSNVLTPIRARGSLTASTLRTVSFLVKLEDQEELEIHIDAQTSLKCCVIRLETFSNHPSVYITPQQWTERIYAACHPRIWQEALKGFLSGVVKIKAFREKLSFTLESPDASVLVPTISLFDKAMQNFQIDPSLTPYIPMTYRVSIRPLEKFLSFAATIDPHHSVVWNFRDPFGSTYVIYGKAADLVEDYMTETKRRSVGMCPVISHPFLFLDDDRMMETQFSTSERFQCWTAVLTLESDGESPLPPKLLRQPTAAILSSLNDEFFASQKSDTLTPTVKDIAEASPTWVEGSAQCGSAAACTSNGGGSSRALPSEERRGVDDDPLPRSGMGGGFADCERVAHEETRELSSVARSIGECRSERKRSAAAILSQDLDEVDDSIAVEDGQSEWESDVPDSEEMIILESSDQRRILQARKAWADQMAPSTQRPLRRTSINLDPIDERGQH